MLNSSDFELIVSAVKKADADLHKHGWAMKIGKALGTLALALIPFLIARWSVEHTLDAQRIQYTLRADKITN